MLRGSVKRRYIMRASVDLEVAQSNSKVLHRNTGICTKGNARCQASHGATRRAFSCDNKECS